MATRMPPDRRCRVCTAPAHMRCSGCMSARYCGETCQHDDWRKGGHRKQCSPRRPAGKGVECLKALDTVLLLRMLCKYSTTGAGGGDGWNTADAETAIAAGYIDTFLGCPIKTDLSGDYADRGAYDRANAASGEGSLFARVADVVFLLTAKERFPGGAEREDGICAAILDRFSETYPDAVMENADGISPYVPYTKLAVVAREATSAEVDGCLRNGSTAEQMARFGGGGGVHAAVVPGAQESLDTCWAAVYHLYMWAEA